MYYIWFKGSSRRGWYISKILLYIYNRDWISSSVNNFGMTCGKHSMGLLSDIAAEIGIHEISNMNFRAILILGLI